MTNDRRLVHRERAQWRRYDRWCREMLARRNGETIRSKAAAPRHPPFRPLPDAFFDIVSRLLHELPDPQILGFLSSPSESMFTTNIGGNWHELFGFVSKSDPSIMRLPFHECMKTRNDGLLVLGVEDD